MVRTLLGKAFVRPEIGLTEVGLADGHVQRVHCAKCSLLSLVMHERRGERSCIRAQAWIAANACLAVLRNTFARSGRRHLAFGCRNSWCMPLLRTQAEAHADRRPTERRQHLRESGLSLRSRQDIGCNATNSIQGQHLRDVVLIPPADKAP